MALCRLAALGSSDDIAVERTRDFVANFRELSQYWQRRLHRGYPVTVPAVRGCSEAYLKAVHLGQMMYR